MRDAIKEVRLDPGTDDVAVDYAARVVPGEPSGHFELALRYNDARALAEYLKGWLAAPA
jgi:hypothetical protein